MTLPIKGAFDPALASEWNAMANLLNGLAGAWTTMDAARITTAGAYLTGTTDPQEAVKLRSVAVTLSINTLYRFRGQTLYTAADPWALEIHKNSTAGTIVGGARLEASAAGANLSWDVTWASPANETGVQFYYVFNRLSGAGSLSLFGVNDGFNNAYASIDRGGASTLLRDVP